MEGQQSEIVGGGCKLLRTVANEKEWNGVGIVLSKELKEDLISVSRKNDPVMSIELGLKEMAVIKYHMCLRSTSGLYRE